VGGVIVIDRRSAEILTATHITGGRSQPPHLARPNHYVDTLQA